MTRTFELHLQSRAATTVRVVALTGLSARIGRGPQCEVRLEGPGLAEVHCLLRRRGETWHLQPVGPPGLLSIEGRPVDAQRPLPLGLPLRVGEHWLTLRHAGSEVASFGPSDPPILIQPAAPQNSAPLPADPSPFTGRAYTDPTTTLGPWSAGSRIDVERARPGTWGAQIEQREHWLKTQQAERRWEARWRAAGESLRSQSAVSPTRVAPPGLDRASISQPLSQPNDRIDGVSGPSHPPSTAPIVQDHIQADCIEPPRVDPEVSHFRAAWEGDPEPDADIAIVEPAPTRTPATSPARHSSGNELARIDPDAVTTTPPPTVEPSDTARTKPSGGRTRAKRSTAHRTKTPRPKLGSVRPLDQEPPRVAPEAPQFEAHWTQGYQDSSVPTVWPEEAQAPGSSAAAELPPRINPSKRPSNAPESPFRTPLPLVDEPTPIGTTEDDDPTSWPAATRILQGVRPRTEGRPASRRQSKQAASNRPLPTRGRPPEQWTLPLWLVWLPATLAALAIGGLGIALAWTWGQDDRMAGLIADRVLEHETLPDGPILGDNQAMIPGPAWWRSTADHLSLQALASSRDPDDPDAGERVDFLLHTARHASPLNREVRYARARAAASGRGEPQPDEAIASLGLSRDVVALAWTARQLLDAGKTDAALQVERQAIALAATTPPNNVEVPAFDPQTRRFLLPGESRISRIIADLAEHEGWSFAQWSSALDGSPVATLAAVRVLKENENPDAEQALDQLIASPDDDAQPPLSLAARGEALALRERWDEASRCYQTAIDRMPIDLVRRSWWVNLAAIADRQGDAVQTRAAWANAKGAHPGDPIARRVAEAEARSGLATDPAQARTP